MADFRTVLMALGRGDVDIGKVSRNIDRLLTRRPDSALDLMGQLRGAFGEDLIDADTYAELKALVSRHADRYEASARPEKTRFTPPPVDQTEIIASEDRAAFGRQTQTDSSVDFDLTGEGESRGDSWPTGDTGSPTGTSWGQPTALTGEAQIKPGSVLKERFALDEVLGVGGMGTVYRGRDLIKVEAKDKNPYVALKVLNEDFKKHPDAFIALQREASRQQKLAHPNIATVYDFDRTSGGTVFLTMELLEGQPLNTFIKKHVKPRGGLPFEEAFPMIRGLGNALVYAHERSIVHSDFKPGNCYLTDLDDRIENRMKVLDFGIARAVKNPGQGEGEKTLFDPGKLGALTPAYASLEMLMEEEPDPRDDIYALACVAYELLTGKHPFNKLPAKNAYENNLIPAPVKGLTRKQMRGLMRGLAFKRQDRSQNVAEFLEELEGRTSPFKNPLIMVPAAIVLITLAGIFPARNALHERAIEQQIARVQSGDPAVIESVLGSLDERFAKQTDRDQILVAARDEIMAHFDGLIRQLVNVPEGRYDFNGARAVVDRVATIEAYGDLAKIQEWRDYVEIAERTLLNEQNERFKRALEQGSLLAANDTDDVHDALTVIEQFAPETARLMKRRLPGAYANAIDSALTSGDFPLARALADAGLGLLGETTTLVNYVDKINGEKERAEAARAILAYVANINAVINDADSLDDFLPVQDDIKGLALIDPDNELLAELKTRIETLASAELKRIGDSRRWGDAELVQHEFGTMLRALGLRNIDVRALSLRDEFERDLNELTLALAAAVAAGKLDPEAERALTRIAKIGPAHPRLTENETALARGYLRAARIDRAENRVDRARTRLARAAELAGDRPLATVIGSELALADGESAAPPERAAVESLVNEFDARVETLAAEPGAVTELETTLDSLESLAPLDPAVAAARTRFGEAVAGAADTLGADGRWNEAVELTRIALAYAPGSSALTERLGTLVARQQEARAEARREYIAERKQRVEALLASPFADSDWGRGIQAEMTEVESLAASDDPWLVDYRVRIADTLVERAVAMRRDERFAEGANLLDRARRFAPELPALIAEQAALAAATDAFEEAQREAERIAKIEGLKQDFATQAAAYDVAAATRTLEELQNIDAADTFVTATAPGLLADAYYELALRKAETQDFAAALKLAKAGLKLKPRSTELRLAVKEYTVDGSRQELNKLLGSGGNFDLEDALDKIADIQAEDPRAFGAKENDWARAIAGRLGSLKESDGLAVNPLIERARNVFIDNPIIATIEPATTAMATSTFGPRIRAALDDAYLSSARDLIKEANATAEATHPEVVQLKGAYNAALRKSKALYDDYKAAFRQRDFEGANSTIDEALSTWADSDVFKKEKARVLAALQRDLGGEQSALPPPPSPQPCSGKLAGFGKRRKGTCYDNVAQNARGPYMVVVPAGGEFSRPFAIGKYEITISDFNKYCKLSGDCEPVEAEDASLPMTGITVQQARDYVSWLSRRTGKNYRLPSPAEWAYAASAGGQQPRKDYNCRIEQGGQVLKGLSPMGVTTGKANGWGLYNYVGNVQEWVQAGEAVSARGGAFNDTFSKCDISLDKAHDGRADESTGFRIALTLG